ncbi:hypothetical protein [Stackebrandtia nassauensis]|uniref:HNH endonuclease n=1 Tax=Stackebrandtia nassauensis (strain DSM 44728 / CIP 108903 / NRRL B-16338 / NBRC 102104 / LLR-40K-21) TaxID=446470 RepID=D3Q396_STANL|nr:hypothetical protein [Stackebrandtia nassauensis]ADD40066.1 conserved hypothetical protein [Stackebrandtia nassauensis DSM 44728]
MAPIRSEDRHRYPKDWKQISARIRHGRAAGRCECDGICGTGHTGRCPARQHHRHPVTGSKVVLTVAHLDRTPEHCDDDNLAAMCQRCHLAYDAEQHASNAARTRFRNATAGMEPLFGLDITTGA